jgi:hypothetical protein
MMSVAPVSSPRPLGLAKLGGPKVVNWIKVNENHASKQAGSNNPIATYDFSWLWTELDVGQLRR